MNSHPPYDPADRWVIIVHVCRNCHCYEAASPAEVVAHKPCPLCDRPMEPLTWEVPPPTPAPEPQRKESAA